MAIDSETTAINCLSCKFGNVYIPQRYIMTIMMHLSLLNAYHMRIVYNIAIVEMVQEIGSTCNDTGHVDACPEFTFEPSVEDPSEVFHWTPGWVSLTLSAFYCGYTISHLPGGWLADKIGARHVMGTCLLISSCLTMIFPLGVEMFGCVGAAVLRMLQGFAQGPILPSISTFMQCWVPENERSFLGGIAFGGCNLGTLTGASLTGLMIFEAHHWDIPFYVWGSLCLVHYAIYLLIIFSHPNTHPFITTQELLYLKDKVESRKSFHVPWTAIFKTMPVWALIAGQFGHNFIFFTMFTDLPQYLKEIQKMEVLENALYTTLPFLMLWISSIAFGYIADVIINKKWMRVITVRKVYTAFASIAPGCFLLFTGYAGCHQEIAIASYTIGLFCMGPFFSGVKVNVNDLTMHYAGTIKALMVTIGSLAGVLATFIVGSLTCDCSLESWIQVFWIDLCVTTACTVFYCIFASAERQQWDFKDDAPLSESP